MDTSAKVSCRQIEMCKTVDRCSKKPSTSLAPAQAQACGKICCCAACGVSFQVRLPVRCEALLRLLLECVRGASSKYQLGGRDGSSNALRAETYVCLIQYMHFCRWAKELQRGLTACLPLLAALNASTGSACIEAAGRQLPSGVGSTWAVRPRSMVCIISNWRN